MIKKRKLKNILSEFRTVMGMIRKIKMCLYETYDNTYYINICLMHIILGMFWNKEAVYGYYF
jgi:hypothetical protein